MSDVVPKSLKFRAFLSYRSSDRKLAVWLHRKLETYRIPKRLVGVPTRFGPVPTRVTPVFRDRDDARGASDIETTIKSYLAQSEHLIVLCTPSSAQSDSWVGREIELFKRERPGAEVHAVIGEGTPPSCIPKQLLRQSGDGTIHSPLAADLRPVAEGGDGMRRGFIKLVASLIGVEFDDLWLREHRRRRLSAMLWSFLIVAAISAGATWIHDHEVTRLTSIGSAAQRLDPVTNQALVDLLTIASTPAEGGLVSSNGYRLEGVAAIASRTRPALSGSVAMRHQDLNARIVFRSDDRQLIFSADDSDVRELFVWNTVTHKLVARIPVRLNYWMPTTTSDLANGTGRLMGLNVSKDGRLVAAVYAPIKDARWIAASWQLDPQGGCKAPCLPKTFNLEMPMPEKWSSGDLRFTADTKSAWFTYRSKMPYVVDFSVGKATPAASLEDVDLRHCSFALPDTVLPKKRRIVSDLPAPPLGLTDLPVPPLEIEEHHWYSEDGNYLAQIRESERILRFFSHADRREVARLELPSTIYCGIDCNVGVTFLGGHRVAINDLNGSYDADSAAGRIVGIATLDGCVFDAWPQIGPISLLSDQLLHAKGKSWGVHRMSSHVATRTGTHIAAVMTLSGDGYKDVGVVFGVQERRPVALFFPPGGHFDNSIQFLEAMKGDYPFRAWTRDGSFLVRANGTLGSFMQADPKWKDLWFLGDPTGVVGKSKPKHEWEPIQWMLPSDETSGAPAVIEAYAGKIQAVAVAADASKLALAQSGVILIQPARPDAIAHAIAIKLAGASIDALSFSSGAEVLAATWKEVQSYDEPHTVSVWSSATGTLLAERPLDFPTRVLAVGNDLSVFIERSGEAVRLNLRTGELTPITTMHNGRIAWSGDQLVIDTGSGQLVTVEPATLSIVRSASLTKDQRLVDVSPDGQTIYSRTFPFPGDRFFNPGNRLFLRDTETGDSWFLGSNKLALVVGKIIEIWDHSVPQRLSRYSGPWKDVMAVWGAADNRELWALDSRGLLYSWSLANDLASSVASACATLKELDRPLEFTDEQMTAFPQLSWADRTPCHRSGPLRLDYYRQFFGNLIGRNQ